MNSCGGGHRQVSDPSHNKKWIQTTVQQHFYHTRPKRVCKRKFPSRCKRSMWEKIVALKPLHFITRKTSLQTFGSTTIELYVPISEFPKNEFFVWGRWHSERTWCVFRKNQLPSTTYAKISLEVFLVPEIQQYGFWVLFWIPDFI